jgi:adenine-specific DNA-methyltransferase
MILGDSLSVMASLAEREGLRGKVQCIYIDPPYGIKFNSNFQWSTTTRDVKDNDKTRITREPEQVKAFRDTWRYGIHSYLTYLRDRLTVARDLLAETGSVFVQIGDENVHRVRALMDEVFGDVNFASIITLTKAASQSSELLAGVNDFILWYACSINFVKYRPLYQEKKPIERPEERYICVETPEGKIYDLSYNQKLGTDPIPEGRFLRMVPANSQTGSESSRFDYSFRGKAFRPPGARGWSTNLIGLRRVDCADRMWAAGTTLMWKYYHEDYSYRPRVSLWDDIRSSGFGLTKTYIVQTVPEVIERCVLMTTDPGDLVIDPTCGSGTTAYVAEQWGRRWITIDTSRVALALARARIIGARYPYYLLADSPEGQRKEGEVTGTPPKETPTHNDIRQGFVYEGVPHITLKSIANNAEIDVIWEGWQETLEPLRSGLNAALGERYEEWEIPRQAAPEWPAEASKVHADWWAARIARQKAIDASIAAKADFEYLYDKPYPDPSRIRVAGPFTVESLSPHRVLAVDADDGLIDTLDLAEKGGEWGEGKPDFAQMVLENLRTAGVQQAHKEDRIAFTSLVPWPGELICAEGRYMEGDQERRAAIFLGPEFGTVARADLVAAAREAADARFDVVIACAFNFDAHSAEFDRLGRIPILKARMNPDLHMADALKTTASGNLFVVFGEPDIEIEPTGDNQIRVKIKGVDVFHPQTGEVDSGGPETIALWFVDTDYNEESFFIRHAYFLGAATDPYKALKTTLKAEIDEEAWESLRSSVSRQFPKPKSGRIAVKVINHLGDEVMKVFLVR